MYKILNSTAFTKITIVNTFLKLEVKKMQFDNDKKKLTVEEGFLKQKS